MENKIKFGRYQKHAKVVVYSYGMVEAKGIVVGACGGKYEVLDERTNNKIIVASHEIFSEALWKKKMTKGRFSERYWNANAEYLRNEKEGGNKMAKKGIGELGAEFLEAQLRLYMLFRRYGSGSISIQFTPDEPADKGHGQQVFPVHSFAVEILDKDKVVK